MALIADSGRLPPILVALIDVLIVNLAMILLFSPTFYDDLVVVKVYYW